jgi:hypothetical protein
MSTDIRPNSDNNRALNGSAPGTPGAGSRSWFASLRSNGVRFLSGAWLRSAHNNDNTPPQDYPAGTSTRFTAATDRFFSVLDRFQNEDQFIHPDSEEIVRKAFNDFLRDSGMVLSQHSLPILMTEKSGQYALRDDGKTPNWYHELRQITGFLSLMRSGKLNEEILEPFGGADVVISAILRHDSIEDHGKTRAEILEGLQRRIREAHARETEQGARSRPPLDFKILDAERDRLLQRAEQVAGIVDLMTRKDPVFENGELLRDKATGRVITIDRFGGDLDAYFNRHLENPIAVLLKYLDSIEGTATRLNVEKFPLAENQAYERKVYRLYGDRAHDEEAAARWPQFASAIRCVDDMLGIDLAILRNNNNYASDPKTNPREGRAVRTRRYADNALEGYCYAPRVCRPDLIALSRVEAMAQTSTRQQDILERMLYPSSGITLMREHVRTPYIRLAGPPAPGNSSTLPDPNGSVGG